ncbi:hypothetical protein SEMRO_591_G171981.1 [Seminavis robusta]|uniref:Uncharacterized protein n=1 Tax=Seminavis robusta TaxID=568900 RepID=A0A9N8HGQ8_9STRA|nr:hypothetical protein SEMRO_591_G171981.1 [Seminavis robusta]|eukprot:Sro591_g171981.1  (193) ;mRNA; f:14052-14630
MKYSVLVQRKMMYYFFVAFRKTCGLFTPHQMLGHPRIDHSLQNLASKVFLLTVPTWYSTHTMHACICCVRQLHELYRSSSLFIFPNAGPWDGVPVCMQGSQNARTLRSLAWNVSTSIESADELVNGAILVLKTKPVFSLTHHFFPSLIFCGLLLETLEYFHDRIASVVGVPRFWSRRARPAESVSVSSPPPK